MVLYIMAQNKLILIVFIIIIFFFAKKKKNSEWEYHYGPKQVDFDCFYYYYIFFAKKKRKIVNGSICSVNHWRRLWGRNLRLSLKKSGWEARNLVGIQKILSPSQLHFSLLGIFPS